jgi:hypothetical protein
MYKCIRICVYKYTGDYEYSTTTEVYPDSPKANDDICNRAQVRGFLFFFWWGGLVYPDSSKANDGIWV